MVSRYPLMIAIAVLLIGCRPATPPPPSYDQTQAASAPTTESTPAPQTTALPKEVRELRNSEYQLGATDDLQTVQLTDGKFERGAAGSEDFTSVTLTDFVAV